MATIHLHQTTTATPEQFLAGLTDFGPGRSKIFPNSADGYLKGRLLQILLATGGKRVLGKALACPDTDAAVGHLHVVHPERPGRRTADHGAGGDVELRAVALARDRRSAPSGPNPDAL